MTIAAGLPTVGAGLLAVGAGVVAIAVLTARWTGGDESTIASLLTVATLAGLLAVGLAGHALYRRGARSCPSWLALGAGIGALALTWRAWHLL